MEAAKHPQPSKGFLTGFAVARGWRFPAGFDIKNFPGMVQCRLLDDERGNLQLQIWWEDRLTYDSKYWKHHLKRDFSLPDDAVTSVLVAEKKHDLHWWNQKSKWLPWVISGIAAGVGLMTNLSGLDSQLGYFIAEPQAAAYGPPRPIRLVEGDEANIKFRLHNKSESAARFLDVSATGSDDCPVAILVSQLGPLTLLSAGEMREIECPVYAVKRGEGAIELKAEFAAGVFKDKSKVKTKAQKVEVWSAIDESPAVSLAQASDNMAWYVVEVRHGRPPAGRMKYHCAYVGLGPELDFLPSQIEGGDPLPLEAGVHLGAPVMEWSSEPAPLQIQRMTFVVRDKKENATHKPDEWNSYAQDFIVSCEPLGTHAE